MRISSKNIKAYSALGVDGIVNLLQKRVTNSICSTEELVLLVSFPTIY